MIYIPRPPHWRPLHRPYLAWADAFSDEIALIEHRDPGALPDLSRASRVYLLSDYAGDDSTYRTYSFLLVTDRAVEGWQRYWTPQREALLPGGRHLEYKSIYSSDSHKRRALQPFLTGVDAMDGLLITLDVDQRIRSMFAEDAELDDRAQTLLSSWTPAVDERLWRIAHFSAFFISGLVRSGQSVWWFSDRDAIASEQQQKEAFWELWLRTLVAYGRGDLDDPRFTSKGKDDGSTIVRDLLAVPDFAAGALADILTTMAPDAMPTRHLLAAVPHVEKPKARGILDWYARRGTRLRRLLCVCTYSGRPDGFRSHWITFTAYDDMRPPRLWVPPHAPLAGAWL